MIILQKKPYLTWMSFISSSAVLMAPFLQTIRLIPAATLAVDAQWNRLVGKNEHKHSEHRDGTTV